MKLLPKQGKCYNCGALGHRENECARPKPQQKEKTEKRESQNPKVAQMLEVADESERENVSKIVAATVREILGDHEPSASVRTLTITDGILGVTSAGQQECDDGTWVLADTGATHEPMSVRKGQKIPAGARPCKLQLALGHVDGWAGADGVVFFSFQTQSCQVFSQFAELLLSAI